jgi:hypothetical protein
MVSEHQHHACTLLLEPWTGVRHRLWYEKYSRHGSFASWVFFYFTYIMTA